MESKFIGCLLGVALGDSLGARREGALSILDKPNNFKDVISLNYTDDTAMTIGLAESLIEKNGLDPEHLARRFLENYEKEPWRGYGPGPPTIFFSWKRGASWQDELDKKIYPGGSFGNGSAMRVAPIGLFYCDSPEQLRQAAYLSSRLTHSHPLAMEGAALLAYAVALALKEDQDFLDKLMAFVEQDIYKLKINKIKYFLSRKDNRREIVRELGHGIEAFNSVPTAIFCFLANPTFEEAILYAISLGGDTDTIAAMCGAIAGARYGLEGLPEKWLQRIENRNYLTQLGQRLYEAYLRSK